MSESCHAYAWGTAHLWMCRWILFWLVCYCQMHRWRMRMLHTSRWHMHMLHTAYCIRSVISSFSNLNRRSGPLGLFYYVPLKRDQGDWDWRLRLNDTPNAIGCTSTPQTHAYVMTVIFRIAGCAIARCLDDASICLTPQDNTFICHIPQAHVYVMTLSTGNTTSQKPTKSRNPDSSVSRSINSNWDLGSICISTKSSSFWIWKILGFSIFSQKCDTYLKISDTWICYIFYIHEYFKVIYRWQMHMLQCIPLTPALGGAL